jgi:hypothetical protein
MFTFSFAISFAHQFEVGEPLVKLSNGDLLDFLYGHVQAIS